MIRPSALGMRCGLAPILAEQFQTTNEAAEHGTLIHAEIPRAWMDHDQAHFPQAQAAIDWLRAHSKHCGSIHFERPLKMLNEETLEILTEGTADCVIDWGDHIDVIDWKTGRPDNVASVEDDSNCQLLAYGLSASRGKPFRCVLVFLDDDGARAQWSRVYREPDYGGLYAKVHAAATREPRAKPGDYCGACYQRLHCPEWTAQTQLAIAGIAMDKALTLDATNAANLSMMLDKAEDWCKAAKMVLKAYVKTGGACVVDGKHLSYSMVKGRETADIAAIREAGLTQYIKQGAPYERAVWRKVK